MFVTAALACVATVSFPPGIDHQARKGGARFRDSKKLGRSREGVSDKGEGMGRKGIACRQSHELTKE